MALTGSGRTARTFALGGAALGLAAMPLPATSAEISFPDDYALVKALLPYSPLVFDLVVQAGRGVAEITYDRRGYDPVTGTFFLSGLRVKRDVADVAIGRLRTDLATVLIEDVAVDTSRLDLPRELRDGLRRLGRTTVTGDILFGVRTDPARSRHDISMRYDLPDIGAFEMTAKIDNFHMMVPFSGVADGSFSDAPAVSGTLVGASIAYEDYGLMSAALAAWADEAGVGPELLKSGMLTTPLQLAAQFTSSLPGGVSPELRERIFAWAATAEGFLRDEDAIRVTLSPAEPVSLQRLQSGMVDEALIVALNPAVSRGFAAPVPAPAQPGSLGAASALISGAGAPQNREDGARALLALAATGDLSAVRAIAGGFGAASPPDLAPDELAGLYGSLLVARALDGGIADSTLHALTRSLPADAVLDAEREAAGYFAAHGGEAGGRDMIGAGTVGGYDADALRAAAYDFYEGRGVPRSFTRALSLALVSAAAGDPFAANLRDRLTEAARHDGIVIDADAARAEAATLWAAYQTARPGDAQ